jgi:hypothetical protein
MHFQWGPAVSRHLTLPFSFPFSPFFLPALTPAHCGGKAASVQPCLQQMSSTHPEVRAVVHPTYPAYISTTAATYPEP